MDPVDAICSSIKDLGLTSRLVTNGTLLTPNRIEQLLKIGITGVKVTYNTLQQERLIQLMGGAKPGDERRILDNIVAVKDAGLWIYVRIGLGQHNFDEIIDLYRVLCDMKVDVIQIKPWIHCQVSPQSIRTSSFCCHGAFMM